MSRRDSEAIPEHDVEEEEDETSDSRSFASAGSVLSSDGSRRYSETLARQRRRSSARSAQVRRHTRRFPLTYDRRRTTGRLVIKVVKKCDIAIMTTLFVIRNKNALHISPLH